MKLCAYCGLSKPLTKEHIWPKGIINRVPTYIGRYSERANKVQAGELVIKDVCQTCNNGILSGLDDYLCKLFDAFFKDFVREHEIVNFEYDYDLLARVLLKLSFNTARASRQPIEYFNSLIPYILGSERIRPENFSLLVQIVKPSKVLEKGFIRNLYPSGVRSGRFELPNLKHENVQYRLVSINSFYFYLLLFNGERQPQLINEICKLTSSQVINPNEMKIMLSSSNEDTHSIYEHHFRENKAKYKEFLEKHEQ
ncbi:hypothetical protein J45TS6_29110 [Paenibacillus sp. J45TS6]|uniref:hypothetical protein n=1 Tax=Paenibacillus sp. J45TS6 TaxID=2807196 RepID=UPI001B2F4FDE|nr:hypothetical protein [Paenibacillus sp. J45TS6]GIP44452.1 hypothetical protein J45TS6_29110 [Paenibacillus sp. J45TS6]